MSLAFDHVHIFTADVDATADWFETFLEAEVIRTDIRVEARVGSLRLFFQRADGNGDLAEDAAGFNHIAFTTVGIDELAESLARKGAVFLKPVETVRPGVRMFFLRGPGGIQVEVLERNSRYQSG